MREVTRGPVDWELQKRARWMVREMNLGEEMAPDELVMSEEGGLEEERPANTEVTKGKEVLCIGAGKGHEMEAILQQFPGVNVTGIDPHDYYAPPVERRMRERGEQVRYLHETIHAGDLKDMPDASVDAATLFFVLHHVDQEEYPAVMAELRRVMKANGKLFVAEDIVESDVERVVTEREDRKMNLELMKHGPHNYRSTNEWRTFFDQEGFVMTRIKEIKPNKVRHGFFVLTRKQDV